MSNAIPTRSRLALRERDGTTCLRCGSSRGTDWHHRRRRAVKGGHFQHCPCNGVTLDRVCHRWVHDNPAKARERGFIVSAYEDDPGANPVYTFYGKVLLHCDGSISHTTSENGKEDHSHA